MIMQNLKQANDVVTDSLKSGSGLISPSPSDWRDQFIYFLLVDRFNDGSKNTPPYNPETTVVDRVDGDEDQWQGGTLKGITGRFDYIKGLGCTALWLSPIFRKRRELNTYHGYGIQNFLDIDRRFGTLEDLQTLIDEIHKREMYVILDIVINDTGDNWAYPGDFPYYYFEGQRFPFGSWPRLTLSQASGGPVMPSGLSNFRTPNGTEERGRSRTGMPFLKPGMGISAPSRSSTPRIGKS